MDTRRLRAWIAVAATALTLVAIGAPAPRASAGTAQIYVPLSPARVLDTRVGLGGSGPLGPQGVVNLDVTGVGGVPESGVGAVVVNVTATQVSQAGFVTVWPGGAPRPDASNLNVQPGVDVPNLVIATVGEDGTINLFSDNGGVQLLADVTGWFPAGSEYAALSPARVLDTRVGLGGSGPLGPQGVVNLDVTGVGGVPESGVGAVVVNVTATQVSQAGFVTVWPGGAPRPDASNLNVQPGVDVPNLVIATVGEDGTINLFSDNGGVQLLADVTGWFPAGSEYAALSPARVLDTRVGLGGSGPLGPQGVVNLDVTGVGGVPESGVGAVVVNVTATQVSQAGFVTVWPGGAPRPDASNLNVQPGVDVPNLVIATVGEDGTINLFSDNGGVQLLADVTGWFPAGSDDPEPPAGLDPDGRLALAAKSSCGIADAATVHCWGEGDGTPTPVAGLADVAWISGGTGIATRHTCVALASGSARCWGDNLNGQLGTGAAGGEQTTPQAVAGLTGVVQIEAGGNHTCAVLGAGTVSCWGSNTNGQIGNGVAGGNVLVPTTVAGLTGVVDIDAGLRHTCAVLETGSVRCWGSNQSGQLGNGSGPANLPDPVAVSLVTDAIDVSTGNGSTCAVLASGAVGCWGTGTLGELGDGQSGPGHQTNEPTQAVGITSATAIELGTAHACAIVAAGAVTCWGRGGSGQLGDGDGDNESTGVAAQGLDGAVALAASDDHTCALRSAGEVRCWGANGAEQSGSSPALQLVVPTAVAGWPDA